LAFCRIASRIPTTGRRIDGLCPFEISKAPKRERDQTQGDLPVGRND
jgi:hypothetical protein